MKKYNIAKPIKYTDKQGAERTYWANVGSLVMFDKQDGTTSIIVEIPAIGLKANAFPLKEKETRTEIPVINEGEPIIEEIPF